MRSNNYNNEFIDPMDLNLGDRNNQNHQENVSEEPKRSWWSKLKDFFKDGRTRFGVGMLMLLFSAYMLIVVISFLMTGDVDQSKVLNNTPIELADSSSEVSNAGAAFGAKLSNDLVYNGLGLAAFVLVLWSLVLGLRMIRAKEMHLFSFTLISVVSICAITMSLGTLSVYYDMAFFPLGGNLGKYCSLYLIKLIGVPGLLMLDFALCMIWVLCCINNLKTVLNKVKSMMPKKKVEEKETEESEQEEEWTAPSELTAFAADQVDDKETEEEIPDEVEYILPDDIEQVSEDDEEADDVPETNKEDNGTISIAPKIEMANGKLVEAYDPTKELANFKFPTIDMLRDIQMKKVNVDIDEQEENKRRITETLENYGIPIKKIDVCVGPTITLFEIIPADGVRISKIKGLEDDIALSLAALGIRIIAPIPGRGTIGIEVPNKDPQTVSMRSVIGSRKFQETKADLPMALGCTISNDVFVADLAKMPHLLVAGATGQGKSVGLNAIITSLLYKKHPAELKFVLIDPKMVEFSLYGILENHYLAKLPDEEKCIITDSTKVVATLNSLVTEMESRYMLLSKARERNIKDYNKKFVGRELNPEKGHRFLPYIVVIIDEFCDLIMEAGKEVERPIVRIAQKARAVGIHMIIATQRPSTNVITGIIKANFPGRIAFRVTQMVDSRTILDCSGAQQLVGKGDMLFSANGSMERIQCAFVDTPEVEKICEHISDQIGYSCAYELPPYVPEEGNGADSSSSSVNLNDRDPLFEEAAAFIVAGETASTSSLQRRYGIGYNRAGRIMDQMEAAGIVGPSQGGKPRRVLVDSIQLGSIIGN